MATDSLYDMEQETSTQIVMTTGGNQIEVPLDEGLRKSLRDLWDSLGIKEIEMDSLIFSV